MHSLYDVPAPAQLHLFLHITGRRPDGYHLLESVFMLIDWHDVLHFERSTSSQISREDLNGVTLPPDDLITRAARALQQATGCTQGVHIGIQKNLPAQAGMGGGSSDAASTLLALNRLWNLKLSRKELQKIGLTLGADVPFFLCGHSAWVSGIGEILEPLHGKNALPEQQFIVIKPEQGLETGQIFTSDLLKRDTKPAIVADFAAEHYGFGRNDLQPVAEGLQPEVMKVRNWLESFKLHARMTGSGSAVFAPMTQTIDLNSAPNTWQIKICKNLESHPLLSWVSG